MFTVLYLLWFLVENLLFHSVATDYEEDPDGKIYSRTPWDSQFAVNLRTMWHQIFFFAKKRKKKEGVHAGTSRQWYRKDVMEMTAVNRKLFSKVTG